MTETKKTATTETTETATFTDLVHRYETATATNPNSTATETALQTLATAIAFSVLRKVCDTTANPTLTTLRRDLTADLHNLDRLAYAVAGATATEYTAEGDPVRVIVDKELNHALTALCGATLSDAYDLVNEGALAILTETAKAQERNEGALPADFMTTPYKVRRLKRKVVIKAENTAKGWETVETTPIRETFKAVRRYIEQSRAVKADPRNGYTYIDDIATDPDTGAGETIYRRYGKFADLGGYATTIGGADTGYTRTDYSTYTADTETATAVYSTLDRLVADLGLNARQAQVIDLRLRGYGNKAIATYLGVDPAIVKRTLKQIQSKCETAGFTPATLAK